MEHYGQWSGGKHHVSCHFTLRTKMSMWGKEEYRYLEKVEEVCPFCLTSLSPRPQ